ncbi:hypothetical protein HYY75_01485, partial [bacterium]|nr:hypothetical protein [bacterium]
YDINGVQQDLKFVGDISGMGNSYVNMIPPYENRDEDGDGHAGGFPSSLFETVPTGRTETGILWCVDWIEGTTFVAPTSDKILQHMVTDSAPTAGLGGKFQYTFPHPGNYQVYAKLNYKYFDYSGLNQNDRPDKLKDNTKNITGIITDKIVYQVQSPSSTSTPGFISNIVLGNKSYDQELPGSPPLYSIGHADNNTYNLSEDKFPTDLSFSFDAQFVRDANRSADPNSPINTAALTTFNGVGVWDYIAAGVKSPGTGPNVYNFVAAPYDYNNNVNPGWAKAEDPTKANGGTKVDSPPTL